MSALLPAMASHEVADDELLAEHRAGNAQALERLVRRHMGVVAGYCRQMTRDRATADDWTQETWFKAVRSLGKFRGDSSFRTWVLRIAANVVRDGWGRSARAMITTNADDLPHPASGTPGEELLHRELDQAITTGLEALPLPLRSALVLTSLQGLTPEEVADLEGCAINTVYWRVHEARKQLRQRLATWIH
jgi:RNA polymerase sigma-70 factor (ECF subfamily)